MNENYQRYLELIENFYQSKNNYLEGNDKHLKCDGCKTDKIYVESEKQIILSCGDHGKCGKKIEIILPKYIYKDKEIELLKSELEKVIDWDVINKYIKVDSKILNDNRELIENNNKNILEIKQKYYEIYRKNNVRIIDDKYKQILKLKEEVEDIRIKLKDISLSLDEKKILRNNYIQKNQEINDNYSDIKENINNIKAYFIESEPSIKIGNLDIVDTKRKKKSKNKISLENFSVGMDVEYNFRNKKYIGKIIKIDPEIKNKVLVKIGSKEKLISISKLNIISKKEVSLEKTVKEPVVEEPVEDKPADKKPADEEPVEDKPADEPIEDPAKESVKEEPVKEEEPVNILYNFKEDMIVSFTSKGKSFKGRVVGINEDKQKVKIKVGKKETLVPPKMLTIIK